MKSCTWRVCRWLLCAALGCCLVVPPAGAQEKQAGKAMSPDEAKMMEMMMKYAATGPQHQMLAKSAGNWKASAKSFMSPGQPEVSEGTSVTKMILGGRYLVDDYKSTFGGMPFEGHGITGYDNYKKQYFNIWMDNFSTGAMMSTGSFDTSGKVLTLSSTYDDPMTGKPTKTRMVLTFVDDNKHQFEMYQTQDGKETKVMEITYTRM